MENHAQQGYKLFKDFEPLSKIAELILYHHTPYDVSKTKIPIGSYVIHLADKISVLFDGSREVLEQVPEVIDVIMNEQQLYHPEAVSALNRLSKKVYIWIESCLIPGLEIIPKKIIDSNKVSVNLAELKGFAKVLSHIIDFRSRFTATHSSGIAAVAMELTRLSGFSDQECKLMEIAGYLHDLGKLAIDNSILMKDGKLDYKEMNIVRKHTYYTYSVLKHIKGLEQLAEWAAFHHEKLNGTGYPFHLEGEQISKLSRIMAVADIFTALTEDRPYREGMSEEDAMKILDNMVANGGIDGDILEIVKRNYQSINDVRIKAQKDASEEYEGFFKNK